MDRFLRSLPLVNHVVHFWVAIGASDVNLRNQHDRSEGVIAALDITGKVLTSSSVSLTRGELDGWLMKLFILRLKL